MSVFGELESDVVEKIKYSKFKAAEIMKAIKSGKTPAPGGPMDHSPSIEESPTQQDPKDSVNPSSIKTPVSNDDPNHTTPEEFIVPESGLDYKTIQQAQKFAKFAISALQYDDVNNAIENLTNALNLLRKE